MSKLEQFNANIKFRSSEEEKERLFSERLSAEKKQIFTLTEEDKALGYELRDKSDEEKKHIRALLEKAGSVLTELGVLNINQYVPKEEQVVIIRNPHTYEEGDCGEFFIRLELPKTMSLDNQEAQLLFFHELSHFLSQKFFRVFADTEEAEYVGTGYNRKSPRYHYGLYEEPIAELFSLYAFGQIDAKRETPYPIQVAFMSALLLRLAEKTEKSFTAVFRDIFIGKMTKDSALFRELVSVFGNRFVKKLNRIGTVGGSLWAGEIEKMNTMAREGGSMRSIKISSLTLITKRVFHLRECLVCLP